MFLFILIFLFQGVKKNRRKILRSSSLGCCNQNMPEKNVLISWRMCAKTLEGLGELPVPKFCNGMTT